MTLAWGQTPLGSSISSARSTGNRPASQQEGISWFQLCTTVTDVRLAESRREGAWGFLTTHLSPKMSPHGHLLSLPGHEELVPALPFSLPSYRSASGLIFSPPPHSLRTTSLLECWNHSHTPCGRLARTNQPPSSPGGFTVETKPLVSERLSLAVTLAF